MSRPPAIEGPCRPPITSAAAVMPIVPLGPTLTSTSDERIRVISVMRNGVCTHDGDGVGRNSRKEECDDEDDQDGRDGLYAAVEARHGKKTKIEMSVAIGRMVRMRFIENVALCVPLGEPRPRFAHELQDCRGLRPGG